MVKCQVYAGLVSAVELPEEPAEGLEMKADSCSKQANPSYH